MAEMVTALKDDEAAERSRNSALSRAHNTQQTTFAIEK